jgi:cell division protein FtsW (lipid II flippase)
MAKRVSVDRWLFGATLLLVLLGLIMVFSASAVMAKDRFGSPYTFVLRQIGWACAGVLAMVVLMRVDYRRYKHPAVVFTLLGAPRHHYRDADCSSVSRSLAQHAPLDTICRVLVPAV